MKKRAYLLRLLFAAALFCGSMLFAETKVGGVLKGENRWDRAGSPYIVECDVLIPRFSHLTIDPGVRVVVNKERFIPAKVPQYDRLDSGSISIRVQGTLSCIGRTTKRIVFAPAEVGSNRLGWYGIIFDKVNGKFNEIAFADITGAYFGVTAGGCNPLVRNCILEQNNIGINGVDEGSMLVYNCVIVNNFVAGIRVQQSNPHIANSIIINNRNHGLWGDGTSKIRFEYNCVFRNHDGNFLDCDPRLGRLTRMKKSKDSVDFAYNKVCDPVFYRTRADSIAFERDVTMPTDSAKVKDKKLAKIIQKKPRAATYAQYGAKKRPRFSLSRYSPCINGGDPGSAFKDADDSRNDMGIYGGPDFFARGKE
ncbi:MAG: right-handed parallel beta-helix repeat-containing protein [Chitinispirillaceae bacterium]|nr:right-handed parallel beta-helix repeat-containing protein [Chitinispirillaceae bacterium]